MEPKDKKVLMAKSDPMVQRARKVLTDLKARKVLMEPKDKKVKKER
jgi:hypothetical protein